MANDRIDSLEIKITSNAQSATNALNTLEKNLNRVGSALESLGNKSSGLNRFANGVNKLSTAMRGMKDSGVGTADFTRLVKNLGQLASVDNAGIVATAKSLQEIGTSMSTLSTVSENAVYVTELAKALGKLGSKGAGQAIQNIPQLATAMRDLLTTLAETPQISSDVLRMTEALAEFVQGAKSYANGTRSMSSASAKITVDMGYAEEALKKLASTLKTVTKAFVVAPFKTFATSVKGLANGLSGAISKIRNFASQSQKAEKSVSKFAQTIGTLYVKFWLLARVLGKVWGAVKSSFDYLETVNYFTSSFESIANKAVDTMSDAGEESAEAYYDTFTKTAKTLTRKLSGFDISGGNLTMAQGANLGLDPNLTLNYQTTFAQIASSMGVASDKAVMLSNVLTEVGADLASVKNMDFEDVWQNMASGLVGMSRAVDKYGVNIRASAMQEKLLSLGINATVKELSQADKALLRIIMILDASKYAWGDLSDTLEMPANQIRMLTANLKKLAMMFGSLFLPMLKTVLPYLNAITIALQRLMQTLMGVLGIDLSDMISSGAGGASDALSDVLDESEGLDDSLENASDNAKKLKNNLLGIDELNILNDNADEGLTAEDLGINGLLDQAFVDAISEYQKAWDEAFAKLENKAQEIADRIVKWAKAVWSPIGTAWEKVGDYVIERWENMADALSKLFQSIASDWATVWSQDNTEKVFESIFKTVGNIFEFIGNIADQFRIAWDESEKGLHILETVRDIVLKIAEHTEKMSASWANWAKTLDFSPILQSILDLLISVKNEADNILGIFDDWQEIFLQPSFSYFIEEFLPSLVDVFRKLIDGIDWSGLRSDFAILFTGLERMTEVLGGGLISLLNNLVDIIIDFVNGQYIRNFAKDFLELADSLSKAKDINDVINAIFDFGEGRVLDATDLVNAITNAFNDAFDKIDFKNLGKRLGGVLNKIFETINWKSLGKAISNIASGFFEMINGALTEIDWFAVGFAIGNFLKGIDWGKIILNVLSAIGTALRGVADAYLGTFLSAPIETGILTAITTVFVGGGLANKISKIVTGKGIASTLISSLLGSSDQMGEETSLFDRIAGSAKKASDSKGLFADANGRVADSVERSNGLLPMELQFFGEAHSKIGGVLKVLGGIASIIGGVALAGLEFGKMWQDGVTLADSALAIFGVALATIGAILLGVPATVALIVAGVVVAIGGIALALHENWDQISAWWTNTVVPAVTGFFEGIGEKFNSFTESVGLKWEELKTNLSTKWLEIKTEFTAFVEEWGLKITEWASNKWEEVTNKIEEVRANIQSKWEEMKQNFADHITAWQESISTWASEHWEEITNKVGEVRDYIQERWSEMQNHFKEHISYWRESITEWASSKWEEITQEMDYIKGEIYTRWESMKADFDDFKERWKERIEEWASAKWDSVIDAMKGLRETINERWTEFKEDFGAFLTDWHDKVGQWASEKWDSVVATFTKLRDGIKEKWTTIKEDASTFWSDFGSNLGSWAKSASEKVADAFSSIKSKLSDTWDNIKSSASSAFENVKSTAENAWDKIQNVFSGSSSTPTRTTSNSNSLLQQVSKSSSSNSLAEMLKKLGVRGYATGGFPEDGLFFANSNELVGRFNNGRTTVANNEQITAGIEQATYNAMMRATQNANTREEELLEELISAVRQGSKISIDGREIVTAYDSRKTRNGYSFA